MFKRLFLGLSLLGFLTLTPAQLQSNGVCHGVTATQQLLPLANEQLTVGATAVGFTAATFKPGTDSNGWGKVAFVSVETANVRFLPTGTPTTTLGHQVVAPNSFTVCGLTTLEGFRAIRDDATDATITVSYFRVQ